MPLTEVIEKGSAVWFSGCCQYKQTVKPPNGNGGVHCVEGVLFSEVSLLYTQYAILCPFVRGMRMTVYSELPPIWTLKMRPPLYSNVPMYAV